VNGKRNGVVVERGMKAWAERVRGTMMIATGQVLGWRVE
jgi:hypothetical protein